MAVKEALYNIAWGSALRVRNAAKRLGVLGAIEPAALKLVPHLIRAPSVETEVTFGRGLRMLVPAGYPSARSFAAGRYEEDVTRLFSTLLRPGMAVVDLGANVGYFSLLASRLVGAGGRVYAFEPDPLTYDYLVKNVERNGCDNVVTVPKAAAGSEGTMGFVRDPHGAESYLAATGTAEPTISVPTVTLDHYFESEGWPRVDLIKMDVEGSEQACLLGMKTFRSRNPAMKLIMEFNQPALGRSGVSPESIARTLLDLGFDRGQIIEKGMAPFAVADSFPRSHAIYNLLLQASSSS